MPPLVSNYFALLCIAVVLCAGMLRLQSACGVSKQWARWLTVAGFVALWLPAGTANIPVVAYVRGVSSDVSITLVALACFALFRDALPSFGDSEKTPVVVAVLAAAVLLYPMALGLGDWDPYRLGWGHPGMWTSLLALVVVCWLNGWRLLPALVALALLAWAAGLLESGNLWDYLLDPWLVVVACINCVKAVATRLARQRRQRAPDAFNAAPH